MYGLLIGSYVIILISSILSFLGGIFDNDDLLTVGGVMSILLSTVSLLSVILIMEGVC